MMLSQIEEKERRQIAMLAAQKPEVVELPKPDVVVLPQAPQAKTIGVKVPADLYERLSALKDRKDERRDTLKKLALQAMVIGIDAVEDRYRPRRARPDPFASYHA